MSLPLAFNSRAAPIAQRGVGLIEVLMAVLVLSVGLLGIALVQTRALANNNSSMGRSMAVVMSYSILEAMRADRANVLAGNYNVTATAGSCGSAPATLVGAQIYAWCQSLSLLGTANTQGQVNCATTVAGTTDPYAECTVTIQFDDSRLGAGNGGTQIVVTQAQI